MKPSVKINLLLPLFLFICALGAFLLWPGNVRAAEVNIGAFKLTTDGVQGTDYSYDEQEKVLTILTNTPITIANNASGATTDRIVVDSNVKDGAITLDGVDIDVSKPDKHCAFSLEGSASVSLSLADTNTLASGGFCAGLQAPAGTALTLSGSGSLKVTGGSRASGIGGGYQRAGGRISITGGIVTAKSGGSGAGIGDGDEGEGAGGDISITGGIVTAEGVGTGAGIGSGYNKAGNSISITGGVVMATGGVWGGAGIGGGYYGAGGDISITGGSVTATGGSGGGAGIGGGHDGAGGTVTIDGGSVRATKGDTNFSYPAEDIGHGASDYVLESGTLQTTRGGQPVDLDRNVVTLDGSKVNIANRAVTGLTAGVNTGVDRTENLAADEYGIHDMKTDANGKVYLYLTEADNELANQRASLKLEGQEPLYTGLFDAARTAALNDRIDNPGTIDLSAPIRGNNLYIWNDSYGIGADENSARANRFAHSGDYTLSGGTKDQPIQNSVTVMADYQGMNAKDETLKTITLNGLNIKFDNDNHNDDNHCAFSLEGSASASLTLAENSDNTLTSGRFCAGLQAPEGTALTIGGSGSLKATSGVNGAGIGGGEEEAGGKIIVSGGSVTATGYNGGAGIGGGARGAGGKITVTGGSVTASGDSGAGIGGGSTRDGGTISINGGIVTAESRDQGAGIGGGTQGDGGTITVSGGSVTATSGVNTTGDVRGACIGGGASGDGGNIRITGGIVIAEGGEFGAGIGGGTQGYGGIITVSGGSVTATGGQNGAGIGDGGDSYKAGGDISITGGIVTAEGGPRGAGIGGGHFGDGGKVSITGGSVAATGGQNGAGIGGGIQGDGGAVTIDGGSVRATAGPQSSSLTYQAENIGHGGGGDVLSSGTLTNKEGSNVYLVTITLANVSAETPVFKADEPKPKNYGLEDVQTDNAGKLYFYLPANDPEHLETWTTVSVKKEKQDGDLATGDLWMENNHNNTLYAGKDDSDLRYSDAALTYNGNAQAPALMRGDKPAKADRVFYKSSQTNWGADNQNINAGSGYQIISQTKAETTSETGQKILTDTYSIEQANPAVTDLPTASSLTYGQKLSDSKLEGGKATDAGGKDLPGTFTWAEPEIKPSVSDSDKTEYRVKFVPNDTINYTAAEAAGITVTVSPAELEINGGTVEPKPYDGSPDATVTSVNFKGLQNGESLAIGKDYTVKDAHYDSADAGNDKTVTVTVQLKDSPITRNYTLPDDEAIISGAVITAATPKMTITAEAGKEIKVGEPVELTVEVKGVGDEPLTGSVKLLDQTLTLENGQATVEYTPKDANPKEITAVYTPDNTNYNSTTASITLTANKKVRGDIIIKDATKTFGEDPFKLTPTGGSLQAGETYTYESNDTTVAEVDTQGIVTLKAAGSAQITVSVDESDAWNKAEATMTLTVNKGDIKGITFESQKLTANGKPQSIEISGSDLPDGASVSYTGNGKTESGVYPVTANIDGGQNYNNLVLTATMTIVNPYAPVKPTTPGEVADAIDKLPTAEEYDKMTDEEKEVVKEAVDTVVDGITEMKPEEQAQIPEDKIEKLGDLYDKVYNVIIHKDTSAAEGLKTHVKEEDIKVYGAGMAAKSLGRDVKITITQDRPTGEEAMAFSLKLYVKEGNDYIPVALSTPIVIEFPLPESVKAEGLEIHHMNPDGSLKEILYPKFNGRDLTFMTTSFSNFLFVETGKPTPTPVPTPGPSPSPTPTQKITNPLTGKTLTMETAMGTGTVILSVTALIALGGWQKLKKRSK